MKNWDKVVFLRPEEYIAGSEKENLIKLEETFEKLERYYYEVEENEKVYREKVKLLLRGDAKVTEIISLMKCEEVQFICCFLNDFKHFEILCHIAEMEEISKEPCVFQNFNSIDDAQTWIQKVIFELRRFELGWGDDYYSEFLNIVLEKKISYICIAQIICQCEIIRKFETGSRVFDFLYRNGLKREAVLFITRLEEMLPYCEEKIMTFSMALLEMQEMKLAYEVLMKYQDPTEEIIEMQKTLLKML